MIEIEITNIVITSIIGLLGVVFSSYFVFKNWLINKINKNLILFYKYYEYLVPIVKKKDNFGFQNWERITLDLIHQSILYFIFNDFIDDFREDPRDESCNKLNKIYNITKNLKNNLKNERIFVLLKLLNFWRKMFKKIRHISQVMCKKTSFVIEENDELFFEIKYNDEDNLIKIINHEILLIPNFIINKRNLVTTSCEKDSLNLKNHFWLEKQKKHKIIKDLKKQKNFSIKILFGIDEQEMFCNCLSFTRFCLNYEEDEIKSINWIFDGTKNYYWNGANCSKTLDEHIIFINDCVKFIYEKFHISNKKDLFKINLHNENVKQEIINKIKY